MTEELESLERVIKKLDEGGFEYFLTGSMAMGFYSVPRMTRDSDIIIQLSGKDIEKFVNLLSENFYIDEIMVRESFDKNIMFNIFDRKTFFKIDFILKTNDEYERIKFNRRRKLKINGIEVCVISIEDLIISKLYWAKDSFSELQLKDIKELMKSKIDENYILNWVSALNLRNVYNKIND